MTFKTDKEVTSQVGEILKRLKGARLHGKHTHAECALALSIHRPAYTMIENGNQKLTVWQLVKLAHFLCVPLTWLIADDIYQTEGKPWHPEWWRRYLIDIDEEKRIAEAQADAAEAFRKMRLSFKK